MKVISGCQCTFPLSLPILSSEDSSPGFFLPSFHLSAPLSLILQPPERPTFHLLLPAPARVAVQRSCFPPTFSVAMETKRQFWKEGESWSAVTAGLGVGGRG